MTMSSLCSAFIVSRLHDGSMYAEMGRAGLKHATRQGRSEQVLDERCTGDSVLIFARYVERIDAHRSNSSYRICYGQTIRVLWPKSYMITKL